MDVIIAIARYSKRSSRMTYMNFRCACKRLRDELPIIPRLCNYDFTLECTTYNFFMDAYRINPREVRRRFKIDPRVEQNCIGEVKLYIKMGLYKEGEEIITKMIAHKLYKEVFNTLPKKNMLRESLNNYMIEAGFK